MFHGEDGNFVFAASRMQLRKIRVALPANATEQMPITRSQRDQVTTAAMVRPEDEPMGAQPREGRRDVLRIEPRTIAPDHHHFIVAERRDSLDGVLEPLAEGRALLQVLVRQTTHKSMPGRKKVDIGGAVCRRVRRSHGEKRTQGLRQAPLYQVSAELVGENENGFSMYEALRHHG